MSAVGWVKRSSKTNRISYTQFVNEMGRQSRSVERPSRIPLRSSSQSIREIAIQNQPKQRSKSQVSAGFAETPLNHGKITPSQYGSKIISGASSTASSKKPTSYKDPRNLQDKEFLKEASHLIQSYFQEKCPEILINNSEIKPMTIKMFIAMVNHLFDVLGILDKGIEPVRFAVSTYEKELPYWMKKLEYPGLITKAWLQTVNVPQYWPHVAGLLSWLVKLCTVCCMFNMEEQINFPKEYLNQAWGIFFFKKSMDAFRFYNEGKEEEYKELCKEVINKFGEMNGASEDALKEIKDEISEIKKKIEDPDLLAEKDACDELEQHLKIQEIQHQKLLDQIEEKEIRIADLKNKTLKTEKECTSIKCEMEDTKSEISRLKAIVSSQAISVEEVETLQKKAEYMDKEIKCLKKECDDYSQLINRYGMEAATVRDKILQSSHAFNRSIIQLEQQIPELGKFHIHVDLESEDAVTQMEEMVKSMESLRDAMEKKYFRLNEEIMESKKRAEEKANSVKELQEAVKIQDSLNEAMIREYAELETALDEEDKLLEREIEAWDEKIKSAEEKIKEIEKLEENKENLELRCESLEKELEETEHYWSEFWRQVEEKWAVVPETLECLLNTVNKQNEELMATLKKEKNESLELLNSQMQATSAPSPLQKSKKQ